MLTSAASQAFVTNDHQPRARVPTLSANARSGARPHDTTAHSHGGQAHTHALAANKQQQVKTSEYGYTVHAEAESLPEVIALPRRRKDKCASAVFERRAATASRLSPSVGMRGALGRPVGLQRAWRWRGCCDAASRRAAQKPCLLLSYLILSYLILS